MQIFTKKIMKNSKNAFTIIELLIIIALISILVLGVMNINFNRQGDGQKLDMFTNQIYSTIELVRNNALMGRWIYHNYSDESPSSSPPLPPLPHCKTPTPSGHCLIHPEKWKVVIQTNATRWSAEERFQVFYNPPQPDVDINKPEKLQPEYRHFVSNKDYNIKELEETFEDNSIFKYAIKSLKCGSVNENDELIDFAEPKGAMLTFQWWKITLQWWDITFSGTPWAPTITGNVCDNKKTLEIELQYRELYKRIRFQSITGVMKKLPWLEIIDEVN